MRFLLNVRIGTRLTLAFASVLTLLGLVIVFALNQSDQIGEASRQVAKSSLHNVMLARTAQGAAQEGAAQLHALFLMPKASQRVAVYPQIDKNTAQRDAAIAELVASNGNLHNRDALDEVARTRKIFVLAFGKTVDAVEIDPAEARHLMLSETMPALHAMLESLDKLVVLESTQADTLIQGLQTIQDNSKRSIFVLALLAVVFAGGSAWAITRSISVPLRQTVAFAREIASGQAHGKLPTAGRDEVGILINALAEMRTGIAAREEKITELAYKDVLTGLPNRLLFNERVSQAVKVAKRANHEMTVLVIDLDRFKVVNDILGHPLGDLLLCKVAHRLQSVVLRESDTVARLGGDEFAILLPTQSSAEGVMVAKRVLAALDTPFDLEGQSVDVSASIGIASSPEHASDVNELMSRADVAMYVAKQSNSGHVLFSSNLAPTSEHGLTLLSDLRRAIENNEFSLNFQPKLQLDQGDCHSAEVLIRWKHPTRGFVPPDLFIPFAEQSGFIKNITRWVLEQACQQAAQWHQQGRSIAINVNVSTRDLIHQDLPAVVLDILGKTHLPTELLCLEITESAIMEDPAQALASLSRLHDMGIKLSIDDFGTGYSSLAYLKKLPVQELKIDRSFVMHLDRDTSDEVIVRSTIELAHNMGLRVVAEGVENAQILAHLQALGCDEAQGYFFSRPLPGPDFLKWFEAAREAQSAKNCAAQTADQVQAVTA